MIPLTSPSFTRQLPGGARATRCACVLVAAALASGALAAGPSPGIVPVKVAPGLTYWEYRIDEKGKELIAHILKVSLDEKKVAIRSLKAHGKEALQTMVGRLVEEGEHVLGAINGDFFHQNTEAGIPHGLQVSDGRLIFGPSRRTMIGFGTDDKPYMGIVELKGTVTLGANAAGRGKKVSLPLDGVNIFPDDYKQRDGVILFTPAFLELEASRYSSLVVTLEKITPALQVGDVCSGRVAKVSYGASDLDVPEDGCVIFFIGKPARTYLEAIQPGISISLKISLPPIVGGVPQAISGGPRILRRGRVTNEFDQEDFTREHSTYLNRKRHPRSAVGYDRAKRYLYLVMIEGRHPASRGLSMKEFGDFLRALGCYDAMGFDGGGSAAMFVDGRGIVSYSSGSGHAEHRAIANSLLITTAKRAGGGLEDIEDLEKELER